GGARMEIPHRHFDARLGHVVAADSLQRGVDLARMIEALADDERRDEAGNDVPHRLGRLAAVVGIRLGDTLAPAFVRFSLRHALDADQYERAIVRTPEARFEKVHQRKAAQEQLDLLDRHAYKLYSAAQWRFTISRSRVPLASARRAWPSGWRRSSRRRRFSRTRRTRSLRTSTRIVRARRCRRSCSTCSIAIAS